MTVRLDRRKPLESNVDRWIRLADKVLRGTCQWLDCEEPVDVSHEKTSFGWCRKHYEQFEKERWQHLEYEHINRYAE
jgi:hypothetical protein